MQLANVLIGAALLLFGRKLFWLFVGGVGFLVGFSFASQLLQGQPQWVLLLVGIGVGLIGAIISIFLERVVVAIAGFFAGGYFLSGLAVALQHSSQPATVTWTAFIVGGVVGAILTAALLDPALILLSSLAGATAIAQNVPLPQAGQGILFIVLLIVGVVVQAMHYSRIRVKSPPPPAE